MKNEIIAESYKRDVSPTKSELRKEKDSSEAKWVKYEFRFTKKIREKDYKNRFFKEKNFFLSERKQRITRKGQRARDL